MLIYLTSNVVILNCWGIVFKYSRRSLWLQRGCHVPAQLSLGTLCTSSPPQSLPTSHPCIICKLLLTFHPLGAISDDPPAFLKVTLGTKKFFFLVHECAEGILLTTVCVLWERCDSFHKRFATEYKSKEKDMTKLCKILNTCCISGLKKRFFSLNLPRFLCASKQKVALLK